MTNHPKPLTKQHGGVQRVSQPADWLRDNEIKRLTDERNQLTQQGAELWERANTAQPAGEPSDGGWADEAAKDIIKGWLWHTKEHDQERARVSIRRHILQHAPAQPSPTPADELNYDAAFRATDSTTAVASYQDCSGSAAPLEPNRGWDDAEQGLMPTPADEEVARALAIRALTEQNSRFALYRSQDPNFRENDVRFWTLQFTTALAEARRAQADNAAWLDAEIQALRDAWRGDIRAHQDGCPASFSNCVPDDCGCGLTELRNNEMDVIATGRAQGTPTTDARTSTHHKHCSIWTVNTGGEKNSCDCVCECTHSMSEHIRPGEHAWYEDCAVEGCPCVKFKASSPTPSDEALLVHLIRQGRGVQTTDVEQGTCTWSGVGDKSAGDEFEFWASACGRNNLNRPYAGQKFCAFCGKPLVEDVPQTK